MLRNAGIFTGWLPSSIIALLHPATRHSSQWSVTIPF